MYLFIDHRSVNNVNFKSNITMGTDNIDDLFKQPTFF